jgi:protein-disulfide isomerase
MRIILIVAILSAVLGCASMHAERQPLFSYDGKQYLRDDLPEAMRQKLFNAEVQYHQEAIKIIRESVIEMYFSEQAKESKKSVAQLRAEAFPTSEPTEEQKKKFYEEIKDKLPYSYEIIKHELGSLMLEKRVQEQEHSILTEIEKNKGVKIFITAPESPLVALKTEKYPRKGAGQAKIQLVEFGDFSCPNCQLAVDAVENMMAKYKDKIEFTWRYYFIHSGGASVRLAKGGHCAHAQGKFWEYYEYVFKNQTSLRWKLPATFVNEIKGINSDEFAKCFDDPKTEEFVNNSHKEGTELGVDGTPTFFVNGKKIVFGAGFKGIESAIEEAL